MYIDKAKIYIKSGDGGDGCTSFYTEKYVAKGGPDGGDGGKGGDVVFVADGDKGSLTDFRFSLRFCADNGERGGGKYRHGKSGADLIIKVPTGTIIRDAESGSVIADMVNECQSVRVLEGGAGGKGNARFKTSRRQAPRFSQSGEKTEERCVTLELKTIADIGLIGYPNVGKSTLLSVISNAKPKIADYSFTTLTPNLGVVRYYDHSFVAADIPGLIDGAAEGAGLGHDFLRHIDRTRLLVHVVDISAADGRDPVEDYRRINNELKKYNPALAKLPQIVALNKIDAAPKGAAEGFRRHVRGKKSLAVSALTRAGIDELIKLTYETLASLPPATPIEYEPFSYKRKASNEFEIARSDNGVFEVFGGFIDELSRNVVLSDYESFNFFQHALKERGVFKELRKAGAKDGDTVRILDFEFEYAE